LLESVTLLYGLAASSASFLTVISSRPTSVSINYPSIPYWGSLETSPMNSRIRFNSSIAPSSLDRIIASPHAGQAKAVRGLGGFPVCAVGGEKKLPSNTCPLRHSHRLNDKASSPVSIIRGSLSCECTLMRLPLDLGCAVRDVDTRFAYFFCETEERTILTYDARLG
jgi:hypothetical protein